MSGRGPTRMTPQHWQLIHKLGITYRQWNHWQNKGWVPISKEVNEVVIDRVRNLAKASRLQTMPLDELADLVADHKVPCL